MEAVGKQWTTGFTISLFGTALSAISIATIINPSPTPNRTANTISLASGVVGGVLVIVGGLLMMVAPTMLRKSKKYLDK